MNHPGLVVDIDCRMTVSRETAETCLKIVEMYINSTIGAKIIEDYHADGTVTFSFPKREDD